MAIAAPAAGVTRMGTLAFAAMANLASPVRARPIALNKIADGSRDSRELITGRGQEDILHFKRRLNLPPIYVRIQRTVFFPT